MRKILNLIILSCTFLITACETDAEIEIPAQESKYVLTSFIDLNSDEQLFSLTKSDPIFDGASNDIYSQVPNAVITINNGSKTVRLFYDASKYFYVLSKDSMLIEGDKTYKVEMSHNGKKINTEFRSISNSSIEEIDIKIDSIMEADEFGNISYTYYAYPKWRDIAGEKNYYCLTFTSLYITPDGDTIANNFNDIYSNLYISDEGFDGQLMNATLEYYGGFFMEVGGNGGIFEVSISKIDEHYYRYFKSLQNYSGDDPFSEPSLIYSNINDGLGVIGSFKSYIFRK